MSWLLITLLSIIGVCIVALFFLFGLLILAVDRHEKTLKLHTQVILNVIEGTKVALHTHDDNITRIAKFLTQAFEHKADENNGDLKN